MRKYLNFMVIILAGIWGLSSFIPETTSASVFKSDDTESNYETLYSFDDRNRHEWIGSNHFEGFLISTEWSSIGTYSLMGILKQQDPTHFEPEFTKVYSPEGRDFSKYSEISVDIRHEEGDCDPGDGLYARIYLTGDDMNLIGVSKRFPVGTDKQTVTMNLPDDMLEDKDASELKSISRFSVEFLPCDSATGNIGIFIDNIKVYLAE